MPLAIGGSSFLEIRDDPGDGVQHFFFCLRLGNALQRGSGSPSVAAAAQQIADIRLIEEKKGLSSLPEELMELARLRLHNPELSLRELGEQLSVPISRSGVNHRLKRLHTMALELREKSDKQEKEERR